RSKLARSLLDDSPTHARPFVSTSTARGSEALTPGIAGLLYGGSYISVTHVSGGFLPRLKRRMRPGMSGADAQMIPSCASAGLCVTAYIAVTIGLSTF